VKQWRYTHACSLLPSPSIIPLARPALKPPDQATILPARCVYEYRWEVGGRKGEARAGVAPSSKGVLTISVPIEVAGHQRLTLEWCGEMGRMVDACELRFKEREKPKWQVGTAASVAEENGCCLSDTSAVYLKGIADRRRQVAAFNSPATAPRVS
jgi:hypothetical protein